MKNGIITAAQPEAAAAGAEILMAGGNAVDAAVACALVQTVVDPLMCGIGGFGSVQLYEAASGKRHAINFQSKAPKAARPDLWADKIVGETSDGFGFIVEGHANECGYLSICTPGTLAGLDAAMRRFGSLPWAQVVEPAIRQAEEGMLVRPHIHTVWTQDERRYGRMNYGEKLGVTEEGRDIYLHADGSYRRVGERIHNPGMVRHLGPLGRRRCRALLPRCARPRDGGRHRGARWPVEPWGPCRLPPDGRGAADRQLSRVRRVHQLAAWGWGHGAGNARHPGSPRVRRPAVQRPGARAHLGRSHEVRNCRQGRACGRPAVRRHPVRPGHRAGAHGFARPTDRGSGKGRCAAYADGLEERAHDARVDDGSPRQRRFAHPFLGAALRHHHEGARVHVERGHGQLRPTPGSAELDPPRWLAFRVHGAHHLVSVGQALPQSRRARRHPHPERHPPGHFKRRRLGHAGPRCGGGAAGVGHVETRSIFRTASPRSRSPDCARRGTRCGAAISATPLPPCTRF